MRDSGSDGSNVPHGGNQGNNRPEPVEIGRAE
jgi:hypothetical protein